MLQNILLFLTLLVLPFQFGKHFWPNFAFISGQRVDYLSPTLYISDIFIILLFVLTLLKKQMKIGLLGMLGLLGVVLYFSIGIFFSQNPLSGWFSLLKLLECIFFGWIVGRSVKELPNFLFWTFSIGVLLEGTLGLLQFVHQGSLNGIWYYLGERTFSASTPGIANASVYGQLFLRPYATFPHPNVFAGYLVISLLFFLTFLFSTKITWQRIVSTFVGVFGFGILLLTLSRVAIVIFIILAGAFLIWKFSQLKYWILLIGCLLLFGIFLTPLLSGRFFYIQGYIESFTFRDMLLQSAWQMFGAHPLLGVGLGNFLPLLPFYISSKLLFGFLQPVHNIFLLVLTETGIVGFGIFLWVLYKAMKNIWHERKNYVSQFALLSLLAICIIGMTDHYFLTLQQGQLLLSLILGICFMKKG